MTAGAAQADGVLTAHRGALLHFVSDPGAQDDAASYEYHEDGLLLIENGRVKQVGAARELLALLPTDLRPIEHPDALLMPGFIDTHIHLPQTDMIAAGGRDLLDWLNRYTFPTERAFGNPAYGDEVAGFFFDELLRNGTTTAQIFCSVHASSADSCFTAAQARGLRTIAGKVLMDRHCPAYLQDTAERGERESRELIERWHGRDRLLYAITPRFAPTSTPEQLAAAGRLARDYPTTYIHTHLAENLDEVAWVRELFPERRSYLDVYDHYGLLRERATFAHCIHLDAEDRHRFSACGACAAHSPTSNLYLGSGLFDFDAADAAGMRYALATDVGGGTSFSMLRTMGEAYKVAQMRGQRLSPLRAFYLATLGGARGLALDHRVGSFKPGSEADFIVLDRRATPLIERRCRHTATLSELLQVFMVLGDDRCVAQTYVMGRQIAGADAGRGAGTAT